MLKVGSASAKKGEKGQGFLNVGELSVHSDIKIPVFIINGLKSGPTLWINGAVHGDEINGFMAARKLAFSINPKDLKGALILTPLCNPLATQWRQKLNPYDFLDLDQQFPGDPEGLISQRIAYYLFKEIKEKANYLINFHTAATPYDAIPYTVYKIMNEVKPEIRQEIDKLAKIFGTRAICKVDIDSAKGELPGNLKGALDLNCALQGIPAFMAEVGSGGKFEEENIEAAEEGIKNVMKYLKMIPGEIILPEKQIIITKRKFLYCNKSGFILMNVKPGDILSKGQKIAQIIDLFSEIEVIEAKEKGFVLIVRINPIVHSGDRVAFLGLEWEYI